MTIKGVLFDFSGTLFRIEPTASWLRAVLAEAGVTLPEPELVRTAERLESAGALAGGALPAGPLPDDLAALWAVRDRSAEAHRAAFTGLSRQVPLPDPELHDALYDRHMTPAAWQPYPDTIEVLGTLRGRGVAVGVVSNIGWDLRPVFREHGADPYVDAYALSYEHGIQKPDTRLFAHACDALGIAPQDTLMVGDEPRADGGAADLGCAVHFVDHRPVTERPDGLRPVLDLIG
ncbi:HAD family hydrolase [Streptomyces yaanensis]|uniref:HAD family hydrolase n=1 Tax=Streptomyces yaanensis TaxID=1142239 RepID=A0ABV7S470_9ACTN|nr:HAD-IA family hydrolase [Streptomyces sp. CGMCC 4.7035]WNB99497.1 HAD-IA family hydrolase [Streptomyces sp. CGMCC 4.7035]